MVFAYTLILAIAAYYFAISFVLHCLQYDRKIKLVLTKQALAKRLDNTKSAELRKWAKQYNIKWRNVHGKNRHLKVNELRSAIFFTITG